MPLDSVSPKTLSLLRFMSGLLFFAHGLQKIAHFPPMPPSPASAAVASAAAKVVTPGPPPQMVAAGWIELVCGALITLGLFGRFASFIASGEMAVAYFMVHAQKSPYPVNNQGDAAILFCFVFLYIVFAGSGPLSLDRLMKKTT
jgi:putative oxidoreductase